MGKNMCQWYNWHGISIQNIQTTHSEKTTNQIKKWAEDATFFFRQRRHTIYNHHMKRYSTSLIMTETQIKTAITCHFIPAKMALIEKYTNNRCWRKHGEKWTLLHCKWGCKLVQPLWKAVWKFLDKIKTELPYDPTILILGIYPEKTKQ